MTEVPAATRSREEAWVRRATEASVATALLLIGLKLWAYWSTESVSVLSGLIDSVLDAAASALNMFAVRQAQQPADHEHRFGHGKAEAIAGLGQSVFIAVSAAILLVEAGRAIMAPAPASSPEIGMAVSAVAMVATLALVGFQAFVLRRTRSLAVSADALHYRGDLLLNLGIILALLAQRYVAWPYIDPAFGLGVGLFILFSAWGIARDSVSMLMDRELPDEERARIKAICLEHPDVLGVHELKTRGAGGTTFIQLHLELDGTMTLLRAHAIADAIEHRLQEAFPGAQIIIHQDPRGLTEPHNQRKAS